MSPFHSRFTHYLGVVAVVSLCSTVAPLMLRAWSTSSPSETSVAVFGGTETDSLAALKVDPGGNATMVGTFENTIDLDPRPGSQAPVSATSFADAFVVRLDANGDFVWGSASRGNAEPTAVTIDTEGFTYIVGSFTGTTDFDPRSGTSNLTSAGARDAFIWKLNSLGNLVWAKRIGSAGSDDFANSLEVKGGFLYVVGSFSGTVDFDPGAGTTNLTPAGIYAHSDAFVLKLDLAGDFVWAKNVGGSNPDSASGVAVDASGSVYLNGSFRGVADFDPGASSSNLISQQDDVFILKLTASGIFAWVKQIGGVQPDIAYSLRMDAIDNIYVSGTFYDFVDFDPGAGSFVLTAGCSDVFVLKLDSLGNFIWAKSIGGPDCADVGYLDVTPTGQILVSGSFSNTADFDPGVGVFELAAGVYPDAFVLKLSATGDFEWARSVGGDYEDYARGVSASVDGKVWFAGSFARSADFDPSAGQSLVSASNASTDAFVLQLNSSGSPTTSSTTTSTTTTSTVVPVSTLWSTTTTNPTNSVVSPITSYSINTFAPTTTTSTITPTSTIPIVQRRPSISINDGDEFTTSELVEVSVVAPSARSKSSGEIVKVELSNDGGFKESKSFSINEGEAALQWRLQSSRKGVITKVVYARFNDSYGGVVLTLSDDIILDNTKPVLRDLTAISTSSTSKAVRVSEIRSRQVNLGVRLVIRGSDSISGLDLIEIRSSVRGAAVAVSFGTSGGSPSARAKTMTKVVTVASGSKTLQVRLVDRAGNTSPWRTVTSK